MPRRAFCLLGMLTLLWACVLLLPAKCLAAQAPENVGDFFRAVEKGDIRPPARPAPGGLDTTQPGTEITPEMLRDIFPAPLSRTAPTLELRPEPAPLFPAMPNARFAPPERPAPATPAPPVLTQPQGGKGISAPPSASSSTLHEYQPTHAAAAPSSSAPRASDASTLSKPTNLPTLPTLPTLEVMVGQMLMLGFVGTELKNTALILQHIRQGRVGGVILLPRNVVSPPQVRMLTAMLQHAAQQTSSQSSPQMPQQPQKTDAQGLPLLLAVEQEGGTAQTLSPTKGFDGLSAAAHLGRGTPEATEVAARRAGLEMAALGINMNLAPVADVNLNPLGEEIGKKFRSYSPDAGRVAAHVLAFGKGLTASRVIPCLKYFPGTGNMGGVPRMGSGVPLGPAPLPDMGGTWRALELRPYAEAFKSGWTGAVMPALAYHRGLDALHPATLSQRMITDVLRRRMGFAGVVISNDLEALTPMYTLEEAMLLAIEAGADMIFLPGRGSAVPIDGAFAHAMLVRLVREGRISTQRVRQSWQRIMTLKYQFLPDSPRP